jgi:hypothetical protein
MKYFITLVSCLLFLPTGSFSQDNSQSNQTQEISAAKVEVYYFHNTRRCATCNAVEDVTLETLKTSYAPQMESGELTFRSLNIEDDANEALARKLNVSGQTLLIVKDGKKKDLTNDAFLYARSKPEKLSEKINKVIGTI